LTTSTFRVSKKEAEEAGWAGRRGKRGEKTYEGPKEVTKENKEEGEKSQNLNDRLVFGFARPNMKPIGSVRISFVHHSSREESFNGSVFPKILGGRHVGSESMFP
jgi:hypothetical protein